MVGVLAQAGGNPAGGAVSADQVQYIVWALVAFGLAGALFAVEVFVPSGGILGVAAVAALAVGVLLLFWVDETVGLLGAVASLMAIPLAIGFALKIWPDTPIGRWLTLKDEQPRVTPESGMISGVSTDGSGLEGVPGPRGLIGVRGEAVSDLRPVGVCRLGGRRVECLAMGGMIESGAGVEVVAVDGREVRVREFRAGR